MVCILQLKECCSFRLGLPRIYILETVKQFFPCFSRLMITWNYKSHQVSTTGVLYVIYQILYDVYIYICMYSTAKDVSFALLSWGMLGRYSSACGGVILLRDSGEL